MTGVLIAGLKILGKGAIATIGIATTSISWIFESITLRTRAILGDLGKNEFDFDPDIISDPGILPQILKISLIIGDSLSKTINDAFTLIVLIITAAPFLALVLYYFWYFLFVFQLWLGYYMLLVLNWYQTVFIIALQIIPAPLNAISNFFAVTAEPMTTLLELGLNFGRVIISSLCPGHTGDIIQDCTILDLGMNFIISFWPIILDFGNLLITFGLQVYNGVGNVICPNGICSPELCASAGKAVGCSFDYNIFFNWVLQAITDSLGWILMAVQLGLALGLDILTYIILGIFGFILPIFTGPAKALNSPQRLLPNVVIPSNIDNAIEWQQTKDMAVQLEDAGIYILGIIKTGLEVGLVLFDATTCNLFRSTYCIPAKICLAFATPISVCIPTSADPCAIVLTFTLQWVCDALHFVRGGCPCDRHIYRNPATNSLILMFGIPTIFASSKDGCIEVSYPDYRLCAKLCLPLLPCVFSPVDPSSPTGVKCLCNGIRDPSGSVVYDGLWVPCELHSGTCTSDTSIIPSLLNL